MTLADRPGPHQFLDRMMRQSLKHPEHLRALLQRVVPELAPNFDCAKARLLEREFPMDDWRGREADLPFEIPYRTGTEELLSLVCVLLEHQSDTDPVIPLRLLYFAVLYWERQWRAWMRLPRPRDPLCLRPVLPIVLYTGATPWGSNRKLIEMFGEPAAFHAFVPDWEPVFWNVAEQTSESLLDSGEEWLQVLAVIRAQKADASEFQRVFEEVFRRMQDLHGKDPPRWYDLLRLVWAWGMWRRPLSERPALLAAAEASQADLICRQEVRLMGQTIAETLLEEGMAKGEARGEIKGALSATRTLLRGLLEGRFGVLPEELLQQIEAATDLGRLQAAVLGVPGLNALEDLRL